MKKFFTLFAACATAFAINAATVEWTVDDLGWPRTDNNKELNGETLQLNSNIAVTFGNGEGTSPVIYRLTTSDQASYVAFYSKNTMTVSATDATITKITFVVDENADDPVTTQTTPGWKVKVGSDTYDIDNPSWTGSAASVEIIGNSKTALLGLNVEYTAEKDTPDTPDTPEEPGEEVELSWLASELTDLANNDLLDGMSFDIDKYLSFSIADNDSDKDALFKKTSSAPTTINLYSKNSITFTAAEGAVINSIQFVVNTSEGTSNTPGWNLQDEAKNSYTAENDTWTGNATEVTFTDKSAAQLKGFVISYSTPSGDEPDEPNVPDQPEEPGDYEAAALFFNGDLVGQGEIAQNVTLSDNGISVTFTSNSANAQIDDISFYYGSEEEYTAIQYRYRPGGKSSNGVNSTNKGVFSFPCAGTLYLYAFNNQADARSLQLIQNDVTIFDHEYLDSDYEEAPNPNPEAESTTIKVWPVLHVEVHKGEATLLWPVNQVMISGFEFVPAEGSNNDGGESGVATVVEFDENAPAYDLLGRPVTDGYRGIVIQNGKKFIRL